MERTFNGRTYRVHRVCRRAGWVRSVSGTILLGFSADETGATHVLGSRGGEWRGDDEDETISRALREIEGGVK